MPDASSARSGNGEFTSEATVSASNTGSQYAGAFFPSSRSFIVQGGIFTSNVTNNVHGAPTPTMPSDFRTIPLGDIDLQKEISLDSKYGVVGRRRRGKSVRRMYSALLHGKKSKMTVAMYQGGNAEAEWQQHISTVSVLRHPNLVQIYGAANSSGMYATVFHDDLIPFHDFLDLYRHSPILTVYIWKFCVGQHAPVKARGSTFLKDMEWDEASNYLFYVFQRPWCSATCTLWIRSSTRRLCADLACGHGPMSPDLTAIPSFYYNPPAYQLISLHQPNPESMAISSMTLEHYHYICSWHLFRELSLSVSSQEPVKLGAVISYSASSQLQTPIEISCLAEDELEIKEQDWIMEDGEEIVSNQMVDGWTRYRSCDAVGRTFVRNLVDQGRSWLSQATHIFSRLQVTSGHENYVLVHQIELRVIISFKCGTLPKGFLFVCPQKDFFLSSNSVRWPDCPAYWSLDPSGVERLSKEGAKSHRFPTVTLDAKVRGKNWDTSVYRGLRQFHAAKGFDPESQAVAGHLGYPLYQLSPDQHAHVDGNEESDGAKCVGIENKELDLTHATPQKRCGCDAEFGFQTDSTRTPLIESSLLLRLEHPEIPLTNQYWRVLASIKLLLIVFLALCRLEGFV